MANYMRLQQTCARCTSIGVVNHGHSKVHFHYSEWFATCRQMGEIEDVVEHDSFAKHVRATILPRYRLRMEVAILNELIGIWVV